MIGINNPWAIPESQIPETGLGFGFKRLKRFADPRRHLKRHLNLARRGLDPAGLLKRRQRHGRRDSIQERILARLAKRRGVMQGSTPRTVTMAVASPEAAAALGDLGIKFPKIGRKLRKKIFKYAAIGTAAYFTAGAALKAGALSKAGGVAKIGGKIAKKKLSKKAKKRLKKQLAGAVKTVVQAGAVPVSPDSVSAQAGAYGIPSGGAPGPEYTQLPSSYDEETGEATTGISSTPAKAGFGGLPPVALLGAAALLAFMLLGGKRRR